MKKVRYEKNISNFCQLNSSSKKHQKCPLNIIRLKAELYKMIHHSLQRRRKGVGRVDNCTPSFWQTASIENLEVVIFSLLFTVCPPIMIASNATD